MDIFLHPSVPQSGRKDPNPKFYHLSVSQPKNWTLIIDSVYFYDFYSYMAIFSHFGPLERPFEAPALSWGPPGPLWEA